MHKNAWLMLATAIGSALCWWPSAILQNSPHRTPIPVLIALVFVALLTGAATALSGGRWVRFWLISSVASFLGMLSSGLIWPNEDGIAQSYLLFGATVVSVMVLLVSLLAALAARFLIRFRGSANGQSS